MKFLALWHLKRFCDKHGLDYAEIDSQLSYSENRRHLESLVQKNLEDLLADAESQYEEYMKNHFLTFYISRTRAGETRSLELGEPIEPTRFSLKAFISSFLWGEFT